jgi:hypothetical protein
MVGRILQTKVVTRRTLHDLPPFIALLNTNVGGGKKLFSPHQTLHSVLRQC